MNLFKKEGDPTKGVPYWKIAREFLEKVRLSESDEIIYSGTVLREIQIKLGEQWYKKVLTGLIQEPKFVFLEVINDDKVLARQWESEYQFGISFYDLVHLAICKRSQCQLITRDQKLLKIAQEKGVIAKKPEEL